MSPGVVADSSIDKRPRALVGGAAHDLRHDGDGGRHHLARQLAVAPARVDHVDCAAELLDRVLAGDFAGDEDLEELCGGVAGAHGWGGFLLVVHVVEDCGLFALVEGHEGVELRGDCVVMSAFEARVTVPGRREELTDGHSCGEAVSVAISAKLGHQQKCQQEGAHDVDLQCSISVSPWIAILLNLQ